MVEIHKNVTAYQFVGPQKEVLANSLHHEVKCHHMTKKLLLK